MDKQQQLLFNSIETIFPQLIEDFEAAGPAHTLHEKAIHAYTIHSFKLLRSVFQSENPLAALENALIENWKVITGNLLCYTALPHHPVTRIWCDAAKVVASNKPHAENGEPANPLLFLIPSLQCVESVHDDYPYLTPALNEANEWDIDLVNILSTHILNDAGTHLLPLRAMLVFDENAGSPTIYNPYIDDNTEPGSVEMSKDEIYRLSKHCLESQTIYEAKQRLDALTLDNGNLLGQLNLLRQKMRENSVHGVGKEFTAGQFFDKNIYDFLAWYDHLDNHSEEPGAIRAFIQKIRNFTSPSVRAFDKELISKIITTATNLPSEFQNYIAPLKPLLNMEEPDQEQLEQARQVIYDVLLKLGIITNKSAAGVDIPPAVEGLLLKLRKYAFKKSNQEDPNTCLKILGDQLEELIKKHAPELSKIGISNERKKLLIAEVVQSFRDAKTALKDKLNLKQPLDGRDKLNLTSGLRSYFSLKLSFNHPQDFEVLELLGEDEIASICADWEIADSLLKSENTEPLVLFALTTSPAKMNALLTALSQSLLHRERKILDRLVPLLIHLLSALDTEKCQAICQQLKPYLIKLFIQKTGKFSNSLRELDSDKRSVVLNSIKDELPKAIKTLPSFCKIYSSRILKDTPLKQSLFEDMKARLPKLPKDIKETTRLYGTLLPDHRTIIFPQGLKDKLENIKTLKGFISLYGSLSPEEAANLFSEYKQHLRGWIETSRNLLDVYKALATEHFNELLDTLEIGKLKKIDTPAQIYTTLRDKYWIPIPHRYLSLLIPLTDEDNIWTYEFLRHAIEPVVTEQLRLVNKAIAPVRLTAVAEITSEHEEKLGEEQRQFLLKSREQVASLFSKVQKRLPEFGLDTVYSLSSVLQSINPEQREFLFSQFILPNLGTIVDSAESWNILLSNLSVSQRQTVNDFVYRRKLLPKMFVRASDVICGPFKYLSEKQRLDIFETFKYRLTQSIHSFYELSNFISNNALSKKECGALFEIFKDGMTGWTDKNAQRITVILAHLDDNKRNDAFKLLERFIHKRIVYLSDLISISVYLSKAQIHRIMPKLELTHEKYSMGRTLESLEKLESTERQLVLDTIFDILPASINTLDDFISLSIYLTPEQCHRLFLAVLDKISSSFTTINSYVELLKKLDAQQACLVFPELAQIITKQTAQIIFCSMLECFNAEREKFIAFCNNQQFPLSYWLGSVADVIFFMKRRMSLDIELFLEVAAPSLAALNLSTQDCDELIYCLPQGELLTLAKYMPALRESMGIESPGRNPQSFFNGYKRRAGAEGPSPAKRFRLTESSEIATSSTEKTPDDSFSAQASQQTLLHDLFPDIAIETDEKSGMDYGF